MNLFINWEMNILKIKYKDIVKKASYGACDKSRFEMVIVCCLRGADAPLF